MLGIGIYENYTINQHKVTEQLIAACLNECDIQPNENLYDNSCFSFCVQEKGISLKGIDESQ